MNLDPVNIDAFNHPEPGGVGLYLADLVMARLKLKARCDKPGTIQRCAGQHISDVDAREAYLVGREAVLRAVNGESGSMITLVRQPALDYRCAAGITPLEGVKNLEKKLPNEYIGESGNDVTDEFKQYARPLIGSALPAYVTLEGWRVQKKLVHSPADRYGTRGA
jgi:6-phosphofructokinase 1